MANYYSTTVIQPTIPDADMTPLERLLLESIFSASDSADGGLYFYAEEGPVDFIVLSRAEIEEALAASAGIAGTVATFVAERLSRVASEEAEIDFDLSSASWEFIFQDIVRRSPTLRYVTAITSFECSKMRPDGFGGMVVLITADRIISKSTHDLIAEFLTETGFDA